jgi:hypothetical protein
MTTLRPPPASPATPEVRRHQEWLGFVQPVGLVVSLPALERAQCWISRDVVREQQMLLALGRGDGNEDAPLALEDPRRLFTDVLGWEETDLATPPETLEVSLREYGEVLRPSFVVASPEGGEEAAAPFQALVLWVPGAPPLDAPLEGAVWAASPQTRLERMLRDADVPIGLLVTGVAVRLVYAPRGESTGHVTFEVAAMCTAAGRPIFAAMLALLSTDRMFGLGAEQRLPAILRDSRRWQNDVSVQLAEQVLAALHELTRGFQAANTASQGALLGEILRSDPSHVYGGLLTTLLRLVFVLYAEDRGLLPVDPVYTASYSVTGLFEKLREDVARHPDTMEQREGGWARLVALFRLLHDGASHGSMRLPARAGRLFDPDAYPFLEGRPHRATRQGGERSELPRVSDSVVLSVLENLLLVRGERLSYRSLDVEHLGSVYEAMMGFTIETVGERSLALRGKRKPGAPPADPFIGLQTLLAVTGGERVDALDELGVDVSGKTASAVRDARSEADLVAALEKKISPLAPDVVPAGHMILQPTPERRRSGSHYTPRALTEPIVARTLEPILAGLGDDPTPEAILDLRICDPAMGSGAFLVAACRALGSRLEAAWQRKGDLAPGPDGSPPRVVIPADEDPLLHARRLVAQRCLYGVDKNPFAVDLAKLSLWLVTLAKDHPFTFVDHALRHGDSLVGLSREQIAGFHWAPETQVSTLRKVIDDAIARAEELRARIHAMGDSDDVGEKARLLRDADDAIEPVRRMGDLVIDAFFGGSTAKERERLLAAHREKVFQGLDLPEAPYAEAVHPFHWEIEFPEVFPRMKRS